MVLKANPFWTDYMYWPYGANLLLHQYTLSVVLFCYTLFPWIGMAAACNIHLVLSFALSGYATFLFARDWKASRPAAFAAGALLAFAPFVSRIIDGGDAACYQILWPYVFFTWFLCRAIRDGGWWNPFVAAAAIIVEWGYSIYYSVYCCLLISVIYVCRERPVEVSLDSHPGGRLRRLAARAAVVGLGLALIGLFISLSHGQREFHGSGSAYQVLAYVAPYLAFWAVLGLYLALNTRLRWRWNPSAFGWRTLAPYATTVGIWAALNGPLIFFTLWIMKTGDYGTNPSPWRGGGNPLDLMWLILPDPAHPLWGDWVRRLYTAIGLGDQESSPLGLLPLAAIAWLWRRRPKDRWVTLWFACFFFSFIITLGPWLKLCGVHWYLPLPFYFLHLLPIYNNLQHGHRFIAFTTLFMALLFAYALDEFRKSHPRLFPRIYFAVFGLLALECLPHARQTWSMQVPALVQGLAGRPPGAILTVPVGAIFNGIAAVGGRGRMLMDISCQSVYQKPIVGGYLARVSRRTYDAMNKDPFLQALFAAEEGGAVAPILRDRGRMKRYLAQMRLTYVLVDSSKIPARLLGAVRHWPLKRLDQDGTLTLYAIAP